MKLPVPKSPFGWTVMAAFFIGIMVGRIITTRNKMLADTRWRRRPAGQGAAAGAAQGGDG
jgi:hypothetical protein